MALFGHRKLCRLAMSFPKVLDVAAGAYKPWTAWLSWMGGLECDCVIEQDRAAG